MKEYSLTIKWGVDGDVTQTYTFNTEAEKEAFLHGVGEGEGWWR